MTQNYLGCYINLYSTINTTRAKCNKKEVHSSPGREVSQGLTSTQGCTQTHTQKKSINNDRNHRAKEIQKRTQGISGFLVLFLPKAFFYVKHF